MRDFLGFLFFVGRGATRWGAGAAVIQFRGVGVVPVSKKFSQLFAKRNRKAMLNRPDSENPIASRLLWRRTKHNHRPNSNQRKSRSFASPESDDRGSGATLIPRKWREIVDSGSSPRSGSDHHVERQDGRSATTLILLHQRPRSCTSP